MELPQADIGVFGGSGFYSFLDNLKPYKIETPYGAPSSQVMIGEIYGKRIAFIPRHGEQHQYPPHMVNYRANLYAFKLLGVKRVIGPCAAGSLKPEIKPGDFVVCDQYVNLTSGRKDTFYDGPITTHISSADPYCPQLREIAIECCKKLGLSFHPKGTVVVIQGPRFSTRAESKWFRSLGWEVINMTQYPEVTLARELEMCYVNISLITDYDTGLENDPSIKPVTHEEVMRIFQENIDKLKFLIIEMIKSIPEERTCPCPSILKGAR
ncbi:MAG: S-methyl-5'-thioadenosine phosphorylase [bacterium]